LLLFKSLDVTEWKARLENERREFERLRDEFLVTRFPGEGDEDGLDPLLADEESVCSSTFQLFITMRH
jgi:hypothetical protein